MARTRSNRLRSLWHELKRRRVLRVAGLYIVAAFATFQGASVLVPALHLPEWTMTFLVVAAIVATPVVVALAWIFDIVPGGIQRTDAVLVPAGPRAPLAPPSPGLLQAPPSPALSVLPSVAVVPFLNLGGDPENDYFADGITEDVIAQLSKLGSLRVISRNSVMSFKRRDRSLREIGAKLGVTTVLDGSVRRQGDRVRVVAELVDAATEHHLWAETYDREMTDIFAIQADVALRIASSLRAQLSPEDQLRLRREPTSDVQAYQLYLQGRHWYIRFTPEGLERAIDYFSRAVAADPRYADAYVGIAMAYAELGESGAIRHEVARRHASDAATQALRLDPASGEAHCAVAHLKSLWEFDWVGAEAGFRRALELCPNSADVHDLFGRMCAALGRFDEALALQHRAQALDPLAHRLDVATTLLRAGRWQEAADEAQRALDFEGGLDRAHATLAWAYVHLGRPEDGIAELERAVALSPGNTQWEAQLGQLLAMAGRTEHAQRILDELSRRAAASFVTPYHLAFVYTGLGQQERALDLLERAFEERAGAIYGIKGSFLFAPLRSHPRFQALLAKMNLSQPTFEPIASDGRHSPDG